LANALQQVENYRNVNRNIAFDCLQIEKLELELGQSQASAAESEARAMQAEDRAAQSDSCVKYLLPQHCNYIFP
jgi:hypothetical protein